MRKPAIPKVYFFYDGVRVPLRDRRKLKRFVERIFAREGKELQSLQYIFCSDKRLLEINRQFLNHDFYTDIISFDLSTKKGIISGEIYISIDRVRENAVAMKQPLWRELYRVIFHGALHLCGYKDKTKPQERTMRDKEEEYLVMYRK